MKTERQLITTALEVQDACNLVGIAQTFASEMLELAVLGTALNKGTTWINTHRVARLWASKIQSLTGDVLPDDFKYLNE